MALLFKGTNQPLGGKSVVLSPFHSTVTSGSSSQGLVPILVMGCLFCLQNLSLYDFLRAYKGPDPLVGDPNQYIIQIGKLHFTVKVMWI